MQSSRQDAQGAVHPHAQANSQESEDIRALRTFARGLTLALLFFLTVGVQSVAGFGSAGGVLRAYMPQSAVTLALIIPVLVSFRRLWNGLRQFAVLWLITGLVWMGATILISPGLPAIVTSQFELGAKIHPCITVVVHASLLTIGWALTVYRQYRGGSFALMSMSGAVAIFLAAGVSVDLQWREDMLAKLPYNAVVTGFEESVSGSPFESSYHLSFQAHPVTRAGFQPIAEQHSLRGPFEELSESGETVQVWEYRWDSGPPNMNFDYTRAELSNGTLTFSWSRYSGL